jgi:hypothetical protein
MSIISRRSWVFFAATAIAFAVSLLYWWQDRSSPVKTESGQLAAQWHLIEEFDPPPYAEWRGLGKLCAAGLAFSVLVDLIAKGRKRA